MRRLCVSLAALSLCLSAVPAGASGDYSPDPAWRLRHGNLSGSDDMAMLSPGNDTRTNFTLLLLDRRGAALTPGKGRKPDQLGALFGWRGLADWLAPSTDTGDHYASGEGSRCVSNTSGAAAFETAVKAAKLPGDEGTKLIAARQALKPDCAKPGDLVSGQLLIKSPAGSAFSSYLSGANLFYNGSFDEAGTIFAGQRNAPDPWVRETARYMAARVEVNRIQANLFDEYGNVKSADQVDQKAVAAADTGLRAYLKDYPNGAYAASAKGLLRRVYWFGGKRDRLAAEYAPLFAQSPAARGLDDVDLADEIDNKLLGDLKPGETTDPLLLATLDLREMRTSDNDEDKDCCKDAIQLAAIEAQRPAFAGNLPLFDYLLAAHAFYIQRKPADVLRLIPDAAKQARFDDVQFSRQVLRGMALEATRDRNARGFWVEMLPGAKADAQHSVLELALAMHDERAGALGQVFAPGSPVDDRDIREILLNNVADAGLLRQQAKGAAAPHERETALFALLYKQLSRGGYAGFLSDVALVPADAPVDTVYSETEDYKELHPALGKFTRSTLLGDNGCPALRKTATELAASPDLPHARLCLADFFRENGFDQFALDTQPAADELGGTPTLFKGAIYARLEVYKQVVASAAATPADKAYALFRAVNCYAPGGNNSCGGVDVAKAQRKAWYNQLKAAYPASRWAKELRYYW